jgi:hypothetical protein
VRSLSAGTYLVRFDAGQYVMTGRLVIQEWTGDDLSDCGVGSRPVTGLAYRPYAIIDNMVLRGSNMLP